MFTCPKCRESLFTEVRNLIWHLRQIHCLSDGQNLKIICSQDGCPRTYYNLNSFSKHLHRSHSTSSSMDADSVQPSYQGETSNSSVETDDLVPDVLEMPSDVAGAVSKLKNYTDLGECAASFMAQMYASSNITLTDVTRSVNCTKELLEKTVDCLQQSTAALLSSLDVPQDSEAVQALMKEFESAKNIFEDVDTKYKMNKYFTEKFSLVKPHEIFLGHRSDTVRKDGQMKQVLAADTCQYVSVIETLKFLFQHEDIQDFFVQNKKNTDAKMRDYCDGSHFSSHPLFKMYPDALQIQLYFDDFETTNPLGSKTKIHKLGAVYFTLKNLPPAWNSSLANIHLCLLFNSIDREVYGFDKILKPLLDDLRFLENSGLIVDLKGHSHQLYGTVCVLTADNLAIHSLCGYLESFSANKFCQFCMIDKADAQFIYDEDKVELRTKDSYQEHVSLNEPSKTGVKEDSCLNNLKYFHVTQNISVDIMHDVLEGVAPLEVKLMLRHFIYEEKLLTLEQLNERISSFQYGYGDIKNKPSVIMNLRNSESALKQTASQMWCLLLVLPFLLGDCVDRKSQHWHLLILLREICSIIFAPVITRGLAVFLKELIIEHHTLFKQLYATNLIPKHHFMIHYPRMMVLFGPLSKLWCMRFEAKHNPFKRLAHSVCNFKNVSKTLAFKHQVQHMYHYKHSDNLAKKMDVPNAYLVSVGSLKKADVLLDNLRLTLEQDLSLTSTVFVSHSIDVYGQSYRTGSVLTLRRDFREEPLFGEVIHILPQSVNESVFVFVRILKVSFFDDHFYAYAVERSDEYELITLAEIFDFRPLYIVTSFDANKLYLNPRYKIV